MIKKEKPNKNDMEFMINQDEYMSAFRKNINKCAKNNNMTLRQIAEKADIPFATLNSFLYGNQKDCKLSTAIKLAKAFDVPLDELVGCSFLNDEEQILLNQARKLPERTQYIIKWFVDMQCKSMDKYSNKRVINVFTPDFKDGLAMYPTKVIEELDITDCSEEVKSKVFMGIKLMCDYYMPTYTPYDTLLIANDRPPRLNENSVIIYYKKMYIARKIVEKEVVKYMSIRDSEFRVEEKEVDSIVGYIADIRYHHSNI